MEVSVSLSPQYTEDKSPAAAHALNPKLNPRAHTFSFTKLSICTSVGFFTFWLAALCLSCWLAAAGFGFETPVSGFREKGNLVVFLQRNFKRKLCLLWNGMVCLFAPAVQWPASTRLLLWAFVASSISCGLQASGYFAAGRGGNMSRRGSRLSSRALKRGVFHVAVGLRCLGSVRVRSCSEPVITR